MPNRKDSFRKSVDSQRIRSTWVSSCSLSEPNIILYTVLKMQRLLLKWGFEVEVSKASDFPHLFNDPYQLLCWLSQIYDAWSRTPKPSSVSQIVTSGATKKVRHCVAWCKESYFCCCPEIQLYIIILSKLWHNLYNVRLESFWIWNVNCLFCACLSDLDKLDNEKNEMNDTDIAALHHFYSRHLDFPDNAALTELFAQVKLTETDSLFCYWIKS